MKRAILIVVAVLTSACASPSPFGCKFNRHRCETPLPDSAIGESTVLVLTHSEEVRPIDALIVAELSEAGFDARTRMQPGETPDFTVTSWYRWSRPWGVLTMSGIWLSVTNANGEPIAESWHLHQSGHGWEQCVKIVSRSIVPRRMRTQLASP